MDKKYSIGLDLGTNSIGWSVINHDFTLAKKSGKSMWGVYLYQEGKTAADRRLQRGSRRRYERRKERIRLLQNLLAAEINMIDDGFLKRLQDSYLLSVERDGKTGRDNHYNLFEGEYNDAKYYGRFKTIYHLRDYLCKTHEQVDIRLVYLALHHIVKYRGNFLHDEENIVASGEGIERRLSDFACQNANIIDKYGVQIDPHGICNILKQIDKTASDKSKEIKVLCGGNKLAEFIGKALCGLKANVKKSFATIDTDFNDAKDIQFGQENFEEIMDENTSVVGEEITVFIQALYEVYLEKTFVDILGDGNDSISGAMISRYKKHEQDLADLKQLLSAHRSLYNKMFVSKRNKRSADASYSNYIKINTKTSRYGKTKVSREEFYKFTKKLLEEIEDSSLKTKILAEIALDRFMPKINDVTNSAIPYQINKTEMEMIIDNQSAFYPCLRENRDKILSILTFRRPYYIGPLKGKYSWIEQEIKERVYPWNFFNLVDEEEARKNFIKKLVEVDGVTGTPKLPLQSITYQKYVVLNELNNIRYKGMPLPIEVKQSIYDELMPSKNQVTIKDIVAFLNQRGLRCLESDLSGFADEKKLLGTMKTYREFRAIFSDDYNDNDEQLYNKAVEYITMFTDAKSKYKVLVKLFEGKNYKLEHIKKLSLKSYVGWGKYSYEHIAEKPIGNERSKSILTLLYETNQNYMSIIYDERYGFKEMIFKEAGKASKIAYDEIIDELYASPAVKKVVWQAVKLVEEIKKIMGCEPEYIFIESTRKPDEKKRTKSRRDQLRELYDNIKQNEYFNNSLSDELISKDDQDLRDEKLYLYLLQLGRCMYTGKMLDINRLSDYEVDHIVPRCFIKDDSIDNKVLVIKEANQRKKELSLNDAVRQKMSSYWAFLLEKKFISQKKYGNLNKNEWSEEDLRRFVSRQMVETNQINKITATVLRSTNMTADVQPVKASIVTEMRKAHTEINPTKYGNFFKLRELNDYHHAKDAYLVAVIGVFTKEIFPMWGNDERAYNIKKLLELREFSEKKTDELVNKRYGVIIDHLIRGEYDCQIEGGELISGIKAYNDILATMDKNDIVVVFKKEFDGETQFYDQTIYSKDDDKKMLPRKYIKDRKGNVVELDPYKYGGYSGVKQSYYVNIEYKKGNKKQQKLVGVSVLDATRYANGDNDAIVKALSKEYDDPIVIGKPIRKKQLIRMDGQLVYISSASEVCNATQLILDPKFHQLLRCVEKGRIDMVERLQNAHELCDEFVEVYVAKLRQYYPLYGSIADRVQAFVSSDYGNLSVAKKCEYIKKLLVITKSGAGRVDMGAEFGGGSGLGRLTGKTIIKDEVDWIDQSMTGYYTNVVKAKD